MFFLFLRRFSRSNGTSSTPHITLGLAFAECAVGNFSESQKLVDKLRESKGELDPKITEDLERLQNAIFEKRTEI